MNTNNIEKAFLKWWQAEYPNMDQTSRDFAFKGYEAAMKEKDERNEKLSDLVSRMNESQCGCLECLAYDD